MDRDTTVIRAEMTHIRAQIDRKIGLLEARAHELTPRRLSSRYLLADRALGGLLTMIGVKMVWSRWRNRYARRAHVRAALESYGRW
jgi:hypothetical protein